MKYIILKEQFASDLERIVNEHLAKGWKLQGGVSVAEVCTPGASRYTTFAQAMVR